ncbi:hypothetical protein D9758_012377 [Tetrapyrgos nigripes]|uniref:Uncharacterized protein n=1 Tax=Tetrapyrgos nigripes TaxID=182062 RepID=A0A8H5D6H8_9AGAR|nr:hypothetical protein D9758_012377 [Tetrapyrgos nigripes]
MGFRFVFVFVSFRLVSSRFRIPFSGPQIPKYTRGPELALGVNVNAGVGVAGFGVGVGVVVGIVVGGADSLVWCDVTYGYDMVDGGWWMVGAWC